MARVVLRWEAAYAERYVIETSNDGQSWVEAAVETDGDGGTDEVVFDAPVPARYVRMRGVERATIGGQRYGYSLWEMEVYGLPSAATAREGGAPAAVRLAAPAPNPLGSRAALAFETAAAGPVRLDVFDVTGRRVATLVDGPLAAGRHEAVLDASALSSGVYVVRLRAGGETRARPVAVAR